MVVECLTAVPQCECNYDQAMRVSINKMLDATPVGGILMAARSWTLVSSRA